MYIFVVRYGGENSGATEGVGASETGEGCGKVSVRDGPAPLHGAPAENYEFLRCAAYTTGVSPR